MQAISGDKWKDVTVVEMVSCAWRERTGKRETALGLLLFLCALSVKYFCFTDAALAIALGPAYSALATMVFLFAGAAFGMDYYTKQVLPAMGPPVPAWPKAE